MSKKQRKAVKAVSHLAGTPVRLVSNGLHKIVPHNKRHSEIVVGGIVMVIAASLNSLNVTALPKCIWDALTWLLHGIGSAPLVEAILGAIDKES